MSGARSLNVFSGLKIRTFSHIRQGVSSRPLFAMMIAFAMLFAPLAMQSGSAMAMAPADHHAQMMKSGHCGEQPATDHDGKLVDKSCCVAMCTAIAVAPVVPVEPHAFAKIMDRPSLTPVHHGFLAELPTPPPRRA